MARKVPPPILRPDASPRHADNSESNQRPDEQYRPDEGRDEGERDHVSPLPPPSPRTGSFGAYGAIPRTPYQRSPPSPNEINYRQRRYDSLNLDAPRRQNACESPTTTMFDFSSFVPNLCGVGSTSPGSPEVTALEGQELYLHFFHEQLRSAQLGEYAAQEEARLDDYHLSEAHFHSQEVDGAMSSRRRRTQSMNLENFQNPIWRETGRELQSLADTFAHSSERILVRERAAQVDVSTINKEKFFALLKELFQGGRVTRERILVLFFFCSDIAILAVQSRISGLLAELTRWSLIFIREQVCSWVHQNGGWSAVLCSGLNFIQQAAVIGMCTAVITCCFIYIRKNLS